MLDRRVLFNFYSSAPSPVMKEKLLVDEEGNLYLPMSINHPVIQMDVIQSVSIPVRLKDATREGEQCDSHCLCLLNTGVFCIAAF